MLYGQSDCRTRTCCTTRQALLESLSLSAMCYDGLAVGDFSETMLNELEALKFDNAPALRSFGSSFPEYLV